MKVYLDYHSTTPCDQLVLNDMAHYFYDQFANPSSPHDFGQHARDAVEKARERVAKLINAEPEQIYFTSGATESNNIVLKGLWLKRITSYSSYAGITFITEPAEHNSVLRCIESMSSGSKVCHENRAGAHYIRIKGDGNLDIDQLEELLARQFTFPVVSIMAANNEVGTIHDIARIGRACKRNGAYFHCDATQALGKVPLDVKELDIDALTMSSHKIYGPKGVGALYLKSTDLITPLFDGGYQNTITSGTINVPGVVGFGRACKILTYNQDENKRIEGLRDLLLSLLKQKIKGLHINGTMENRLPNNLNICIDDVPSEAIIVGMDDISVSGGSACKGSGLKTSHVLEAMRVEHPETAIRFGLGRWTTEEEIRYAADRISEVVSEVRNAKDS